MEDNQEFQAISVNEVPSIDVNQIDSLQLKDGTLLVVQDEVDQVVAEGEQFYEEVQDQVCEECAASLEDYADDQSNQLRARPMMGVAPRPLIAPRPMLVVPMGPIRHKPMVVPRGPIMGNVMPMGRPIFRARPGQGMQQGGFGTGGYGKQQGGFGPQQGGFGPQQGGFGTQQVVFGPQQGGLGKQQVCFWPQQGGFGKQQQGFGPQQGGFGKQQQGFGPQAGGFGKQQQGFGPQQGGFGKQQQGFGPQQGGFGKQQQGFGPQQGGFGPQKGGFGPQQGGFDKQQQGFGPQQGGFGPQKGGFGPQQAGFGQQQGNGPQSGIGKQQGGSVPQQTGGTQIKPVPSSDKPKQVTTDTASNIKPPANQPNKPEQMPPVQHQTINNMIQYGGNFRTRPQEEAQEEDYQEENIQQEEAGQYECNCNNEEYQEEEQNLRARPMMMVGRPMVQPNRIGFPHPKPVMPLAPPRRGPMNHVPMVGYNTYQPRVFRTRRGYMGPKTMFRPLNPTFQPKPFGGYGMGVRGVRPISYHQGRNVVMPPMGCVLRNRPRSNSCDKEEYDNEEENECQLNTEGAECKNTCVCSKCGKEF